MTALLLPALLLLAPSDDWFETGLDYLRKGFFVRARAAFSECLLAAPGECVPLALLGVSAAAEGRASRDCARILRRAVAQLPQGKSFAFDLRALLPGERSLESLKDAWRSRREPEASEVLAFLEVFDGDAGSAAVLDRLARERPQDPYVVALLRIRAGRSPGSSPTSPPIASGSRGAS